MKRLIYFTPSFLLLSFILFLSFVKISVPDNDIMIPHIDKIVHFIMYCTMGFTIFFDWTRCFSNDRVNLTGAFCSLIITSSIGAIIELLQSIITLTRTTEVLDLVANTCGATFGVIVGLILVNRVITIFNYIIKANPFRLKS